MFLVLFKKNKSPGHRVEASRANVFGSFFKKNKPSGKRVEASQS
jgi:hypothetical protein